MLTSRKIGQALRLALNEGMHTDVHNHTLPSSVIERRREIWWTVYTLDRQMTALLGVPPSISDDNIYCNLPQFAGSTMKLAASNILVKLAKALATITQSQYHPRGWPWSSLTRSSCIWKTRSLRPERQNRSEDNRRSQR